MPRLIDPVTLLPITLDALTAAQIPTLSLAKISDAGTIASQAASNVAITGGSVSGLTTLAMTSGKITVPGSTTANSAEFGTFGLQGYGTNNGWLSDNGYYDGANFRSRNAGYASFLYFLNGSLEFFGTASSIGANTPASAIARLKINPDGSVGIGGNIAHDGTTSLTGASFALDTAGNAGLFNSTPLVDASLKYNLDLWTTAAYNASPVVGIRAVYKYTSGGGLAGGAGISLGKENTTDGNYAGYVGIHTRASTGGMVERMRVDSNGNLVIGSTNSVSQAAPIYISSGGTYGNNTPGNAGNLKWRLYDDGGSYYGLGMSPALMEFQVPATASLAFFVSGAQAFKINSNSNVAIGTNTSPTARLHLPAGTATTNTAPIKLTSGTSLTTPEDGAIEYDGTDVYITDSTATRRKIVTEEIMFYNGTFLA